MMLPVCRSIMFVRSHIQKMIEKIPFANADCICLDLEDAVPNGMKETAREKIKQYLDSDICKNDRTFVRVNPIETGMTLADVVATASKTLRGYIYPMCKNPEDIISFSAQLRLIEMQNGIPENHFEIIPLIETPEAVEKLYQIASCSKRITGLLFGCEDYLAAIGAIHMENDVSIQYARSKIIGVAKSCNILAIDTPYVKVKDDEGLLLFATRAANMGMDGMLTLSPLQTQIANEIYSPSNDEVEYARSVIEAKSEAENQSRGVIIHQGKFISPPTIKAAEKLIRKYKKIQEW